MTVSLKSLRISSEYDSSGFVSGARAQIAAELGLIDASKQRGAALAQADAQVRKSIAFAHDYERAVRQAANDNATASESWRSTAVEVASLANHLKAAALALYVFSPAFRAAVNPAVAAAAAAVLPAAFSATAASIRALMPHLSSALAFLSRISAPILAVAAAWTALNVIVDQGSSLLEKYGTASRSLDGANMKSNLEALTKLQQQDSNVTAEQARRAAELNTRLEDAKFRLGEILKVQYNVNDAALALQSIWTNIVELVAKYADKLPSGPPADPAFERALEEAAAGRSVGEQGATVVDRSIDKAKELAEAYRRARAEISATLGTRAAAGGDPDAIIGGTFGARWNAAIDALAKGTDKAKEGVKETRGEFDRLIESMERARAAQEADARTMGQSAGEVARLRTEYRLIEAAQQDIAKNGGQLSDYADRIKQMSDRAAEAALNLEKARVASQIEFNRQTMFLSPQDVQIAQQLRSLYGADVPAALASSEAAVLRLQMQQKAMFDSAKQGAEQFLGSLASGLMQNKSLTDGLNSAFSNLGNMAANAGIKNLLEGNFAMAAVDAAIAIGSKLASGFFDDGHQKAIEEAQRRWAEMTAELQQFDATAKGIDFGAPVSALGKPAANDNIKQAAPSSEPPATCDIEDVEYERFEYRQAA